MVEIEFDFQQQKVVIQANFTEIFENVVIRLKNKIKIPDNACFLANGKTINKNDIIQDIMNEAERQNKKLKILAFNLDTPAPENKNFIKSRDIICPECKELCLYEINDYKIRLYDCKNEHETKNIRLNEFMNTQTIDISKIICGKCKTNKSLTYHNEFFICNDCNINLCPLCKSTHDNNHSIINYNTKNYVCDKHSKSFVKYCEDCKNDLCFLCLNDHEDHNIINYEDELIDIKELRKNMKELRKIIDKFKNNLQETIMKFNKVMEYMDIYYDINNNILDNYEKDKNIYYNLLLNLNEINESINNEIDFISYNLDYGNNLNHIIYTYQEFINKNKSIKINYQPKENQTEKLRIFSKDFVENNIYKCKIKYNDTEYDLTEYFDEITSYDRKSLITLKLKGINNITYVNSMFKGCECLYSLPNLSKLNISNITDISCMFDGCKSLTLLPDISNWDTSNIIFIYGLFQNCESLQDLSKISKWNTSNVFNMNSIFNGCKSLSSLPNISKWNTINVHYMSFMFCNCESLSSLPDISKLKTSKVETMEGMFWNCKMLSSLPDLSKWNISKVTELSYMFKDCVSLSSLPDLSKWNTSNVNNLNNIFSGCESLNSLPDLSKWNTSNVTNMNCMFEKCKSLLSLPDIDSWNISNVNTMDLMFSQCSEKLKIPSKFIK